MFSFVLYTLVKSLPEIQHNVFTIAEGIAAILNRIVSFRSSSVICLCV